jgi:HD-GYP domain-containing protein (c-di-GMP phosphodiesterase class II)
MSKKLGERLIAAGLVSRDAVEQGLEQQRLTGHRLGDSLVEMGLLGEATLLRFLASEFNTRYVSAEKLARAQVPTELLDRVPVRLAESHGLLPLAVDDERRILSIVAAEPQNEEVLREIATVADVDEVYAYVALRSVVAAGIQKHYYGDTTAFAVPPSGARGANRADLSGIAAAYESSGSSRSAPPLAFRLRGDSSHGAAVPRRSRTTGESGLSSGRGAMGGNDYVETVRVLVDQLEASRGELKGHSGQLSRQAALVARRMALPSREVASVAVAALIHDLGKGPTHLTLAGTARDPELKAAARKVTMAPLQMFEAVNFPAQVGGTLAQLYEAWDGSGTPQGAKGEDIALGARILSAVDSWLELTRNPANPFGRLFTREQALSYLAEQAGKLFDPRVVEMLELVHSGELLRRRLESDGRQILVADPDSGPARRGGPRPRQAGLVVHATSSVEGALEAAPQRPLAVLGGAGRGGADRAGGPAPPDAPLAGTPLLVAGSWTAPEGASSSRRDRLLDAVEARRSPRVQEVLEQRIAEGRRRGWSRAPPTSWPPGTCCGSWAGEESRAGSPCGPTPARACSTSSTGG